MEVSSVIKGAVEGVKRVGVGEYLRIQIGGLESGWGRRIWTRK